MLDKIRLKIAQSIIGKKSWTLTSPELSQFVSSFYGGYPQPGQPIYTDITLSKALKEGYKWAVPVYRAVRVIVQTGSGIPWVVLDKDGEQIPEHSFIQLMKKPNPFMSGQDLMEFLIAHLKLCGNAIWQPIRVPEKTGVPREVWPIMPDMVRPVPSKDKAKWVDYWEYTDVYGVQVKVPYETFIHFMQFDPGNPYWGIGDLQSAGRTIDADNEAMDTQKVSMQNRGMHSGILSPAKEGITEPQYEETVRSFKERYLDKAKRREPWIFSQPVNWVDTSMTPVEMDYIQSRMQNLRAIGAAFGIDPWWLGDREHSTYNNVQEARKSLYQDTIIPLLDDIKNTLNMKLAPMYGEDIEIAYDLSNIPALREDNSKKIEQARNLWGMGVPFNQINEKLELGFDEFEGWDIGYIPFNLSPAGSTDEEMSQPFSREAIKSFNLSSEEQKAGHWKRFDTRRRAWELVLSKKIKPLYEKTGREVAKAIQSQKAVKADSGTLVSRAKEVIKSLFSQWEILLGVAGLSIATDFGESTATDLGTPFNPYSIAMQAWVKEHAAENIKTISDTQLDKVRNIIIKGVDENLSNPQIAKEIREFYDKDSRWMAMRVARTETGMAASHGSMEAARQSGVARVKIWSTSRDDRVRDSHVIMEGEEVGIEDYFSNGMLAPGMGNDPAEIINCRCVLSYRA